MRILSETGVSNLSLPSNACIAEKNDARTDILVKCEEPGRTVDLFYRTAEMIAPSLIYAENEDGTEFAVSASLIPTFDPV